MSYELVSCLTNWFHVLRVEFVSYELIFCLRSLFHASRIDNMSYELMTCDMMDLQDEDLLDHVLKLASRERYIISIPLPWGGGGGGRGGEGGNKVCTAKFI